MYESGYQFRMGSSQSKKSSTTNHPPKDMKIGQELWESTLSAISVGIKRLMCRFHMKRNKEIALQLWKTIGCVKSSLSKFAHSGLKDEETSRVEGLWGQGKWSYVLQKKETAIIDCTLPSDSESQGSSTPPDVSEEKYHLFTHSDPVMLFSVTVKAEQ